MSTLYLTTSTQLVLTFLLLLDLGPCVKRTQEKPHEQPNLHALRYLSKKSRRQRTILHGLLGRQRANEYKYFIYRL
jgi:hypothetical protein